MPTDRRVAPQVDQQSFDRALRFVLRWEGGYVDHPADPGGRTNKGVTQRVYAAWRAARRLPQRDVKLIGDDEVHAIYLDDYWRRACCGELPHPLDMAIFDTAVNMGVKRATCLLQESVGCKADGRFGPATRKAVAGCDPGTGLVAFCNAREAFYRRLVATRPPMSVFLKGWMSRLDALRRDCGLPGFEHVPRRAAGEAAPTRRIPDLGEDPELNSQEFF